MDKAESGLLRVLRTNTGQEQIRERPRYENIQTAWCVDRYLSLNK